MGNFNLKQDIPRFKISFFTSDTAGSENKPATRGKEKVLIYENDLYSISAKTISKSNLNRYFTIPLTNGKLSWDKRGGKFDE